MSAKTETCCRCGKKPQCSDEWHGDCGLMASFTKAAGGAKTKAEELAAFVEDYRRCGNGRPSESALAAVAAELRRLAGVEAERDALQRKVSDQALQWLTLDAQATELMAERDGLAAEVEALRAALEKAQIPKEHLALDVGHRDCHKAADAFWEYWQANGETHRRGYYESTWGAINAALRVVGIRRHEYSRLAAAIDAARKEQG